jgi:tetratricopeptide (TPR) repeat protein
VSERSPGRFTFHDLLRAYAAELADEHDPESDRVAAFNRLIDYCVHTAARAHQLLNPHHDEPITLAPAQTGVTIEAVGSHAQARFWFATERAVLLAALRRAREAGLEEQAWQLVWAITPFLEYQGYWHEWLAALEACQSPPDRRCHAMIIRLLGRCLVRLGRFGAANEKLHQALDEYTELDDRVGLAHTHRDLCWMLDFQQRHEHALSHAEQAYELFRAAGHSSGEARALNAIGWFHLALGDPAFALERCEDALARQLRIGDRFGQGETLDSLGYIYRHLGRMDRAIACYQQALELYREFGDWFNEADTLTYLGDAYYAAGDLAAAQAAWAEALPILERLVHPNAERLRAKLYAVRNGVPVDAEPSLLGS